MATLTANLTLTSTDASSDELSLTTSKALTIGPPQVGISKISVPAGSGNKAIIVPSLDARRFVYVKHTGVDAGGSTVATEIYVETSDGAWFSKLAAQEWMFLPINANGAQVIQLRATSGTIVAEYAYFTRG